MDVKQSLIDLSSAKLRKASQLKERIETLSRELASLLGEIVPAPIAAIHRKRRTMSASARKRISDAAKARWARLRASKK